MLRAGEGSFGTHDTIGHDPSCQATTGTWRPVSEAWQVHGDTRLTRVRDSLGQERLQVTAKYGSPSTVETDQSGLDLSSSTVSQQRGIMVELPLYSTATYNVADLRVIIQSPQWNRAASHPGDALTGTVEGDALLPNLNGSPLRAATDEVWDACVDGDGNLATGTGRRFIIVDDTVQLLSDRLGTMRVFSVN